MAEQETWGRTFDASGRYPHYSTWHLADWPAGNHPLAACGRRWSTSSSQVTHDRSNLQEIKAEPSLYIGAEKICQACLRKARARYGPDR